MDRGDLAFATIGEVGARLRAGAVTSVGLTELMLDRIESLDSQLNAYVTVTAERARAEARAADQALARGCDFGSLHGIPVAVKDLFATSGIRTTGGSKLYQHWVPKEDATAVRRLREAGAVLLGKTGLHELAFGTTSTNPFFGPITNPWRPDHHPGGSSGGSAVAVAAGMAYAALGTDTGCSVRQPAHCCGIVGLKPTFGLVSKAGVLPLVWTMDHVGPMARSAADAALVLQAIAGPDPADPYSANSALPTTVRGSESSLEGVRIGIPRRFFFEGGNPEVAALVEAALDVLRGLGAVLEEVDLPGLEGAFRAAGATFAEAGAIYGEDLRERPDHFSAELRGKLRHELRVTSAAYAAAQHTRRLFSAEMAAVMGGYCALAMPTSTIAAAPIGTPAPNQGFYSWRNAGIFNFTGQPAISVPCGLTADGLPVGLMIAGRPFEDATVLQIAQAFEGATPWRGMRPSGLDGGNPSPTPPPG